MTDANNIYNPFSNYGSIVYDDQFVGRQEAIRTIQQRIINSPNPGCLAIVGAPRIGKSSLAYQILIYPQTSLIKQKILSFRINLPNINTYDELFCALVKQTLETLEDNDIEEEPSISAYFRLLRGRELLTKNLHWQDLQHEVHKFFKRVKKLGWRVVAVIDEFDEARHIFKNRAEFQILRELGYQPESRICLVTVSRRSLSEITRQSRKDISTFPGIFLDEILRCFNHSELRQLLDKLTKIGLQITDEIFDFFWKNTGGHPYLASALAFEVAKDWLDHQQYNLNTALEKATPQFLKYYDHIIEILKENNSLEKLLQTLFGPIITATKIDADRFIRYGLIQPDPNGYYTAFSSHFYDYLRLVARSVDLWSLWKDTEKKLRIVITEILEQEYKTDNWIPALEKAKPNLKKIIENCSNAQEKEQKSFGARASVNLLDFTYPQDLLAIITAHWNLFQPILKQDKNYWNQRFQLLAKLRNPMAHIRDEVIEQHERQIAEGYCQEILYLLSQN
jgi:hypothetical protein